jgi:oligopeptide transport system permease protein
MLKFIAKRIGYMFLTLFIVTTITFMLIRAIPGDPLASMARKLPEQTRWNYYAKYGLDQRVMVQYGVFLKNLVLHGDLGESLTYPGRKVTETIQKYAPVSGRLGIQAIGMGFTIGILMGILAAFNRNKWPDYLVMFIAILGVSVPSFVIASLLQYFLSVKWQVLPTIGWGAFKYTILPSIALSFGSIAKYARYMRANCLDIIGQDYILTAKAKGVSKISLVVKHVIRNAILPAITLLGPQIAMIFVGSFVIESIFSIPGLGSYFVSSISNRDYTMIMGQTMFISFLFVSSLVVVDILYGVIDPRIRLGGGKK